MREHFGAQNVASRAHLWIQLWLICFSQPIKRAMALDVAGTDFSGMIPYPEIDLSHLLYGHVEYVFYRKKTCIIHKSNWAILGTFHESHWIMICITCHHRWRRRSRAWPRAMRNESAVRTSDVGVKQTTMTGLFFQTEIRWDTWCEFLENVRYKAKTLDTNE